MAATRPRGIYPVKSEPSFKAQVLYSENPTQMPQPGKDPTWVSNLSDPEQGEIIVTQMSPTRMAMQVRNARLGPNTDLKASGYIFVDGSGDWPIAYNDRIF